MSIQSDRSVTTVSSERLQDDDSENTVHDDGATYDDGKSVLDKTRPEMFETNYYDYENEFGDEYEGQLEVDKNNKKQVDRSKSILEEEALAENVLTASEAGMGLSRISLVGNGLQYAFIQIDIEDRNLTNIEEIANFKYLSIINLSHNHLDLHGLDVLRGLEYVVSVQADHNDVNSLCLSCMPYLQVLTLNSNKISSLSGLKQPSLERLELNDNNISNLIQTSRENYGENYCSDIDCPNLSTLALSRNALETVEQLTFVSVKLRVLYLSYNKIDNLKGLDDLSNLSHLHLRANRISNLDGFADNMKCLSYLNLRENNLSDVKELNKLTCLKSLKTLVISHNHFKQSPITIKYKVLRLLPWLKRIDKKPVSIPEVEAAAMEYNSESGQASEEFTYEEE